MTTSSLFRYRYAAAAIAVLSLTACGARPETGTSPSATTPGAAPDTSSPEGRAEADSVKFENLMADCMKAAGFTYVPHPMQYTRPASNLAGQDPALVPYDQLKTYRAKYGFGVYARDVYPNDPNVAVPGTDNPNPNNAIRDGLDPARRQAYDLALDNGSRDKLSYEQAKKGVPKEPGGCVDKVTKQVGPAEPAKTSDAAAEAAAQQATQAFQTDPQVLQAAQNYGSCLRNLGYTVPNTKPGFIEHTLEQVVSAQHENTAPGSAAQGLTQEIKTALDDLDCGKDYEVKAKPFVRRLLSAGQG
jgi:hypothetical protein